MQQHFADGTPAQCCNNYRWKVKKNGRGAGGLAKFSIAIWRCVAHVTDLYASCICCWLVGMTDTLVRLHSRDMRLKTSHLKNLYRSCRPLTSSYSRTAWIAATQAVCGLIKGRSNDKQQPVVYCQLFWNNSLNKPVALAKQLAVMKFTGAYCWHYRYVSSQNILFWIIAGNCTAGAVC